MAAARIIHSDPIAFASLTNFIKPYEAAGRTLSAAMLLWFLETIYRLEEVEAQDAVCDGKGDVCIDALDVRDDQEEIVVFQAKHRERLPATLGDSDLQKFAGAVLQFKSKTGIENLANTTKNTDLRNLIINKKVAEKVAKGYGVRPIFVTNVAANADAENFLKHAGKNIDLWDLRRLEPVLKQLTRDWFVDIPFRLGLDGKKLFHVGAKANPALVFAAIPAKQLVQLPGISDTRIFAQNVRLGLGKTRVNKEMWATIEQTAEHKDFLNFHNGLTIVAKDIKVRGNGLTLNNYSVCNGCQSLLAFYDHRAVLTNKLEVLVRIVKVGSDRKLSESIAYRTNNQNAISMRDLSSNEAGQVKLKTEFDDAFGNDSTYVIKQGETAKSPPLHNELAGRQLLSLYVRQPWSAHQVYRIFSDLENQIFSYDRTAYHIRLAQLMSELVEKKLDDLKFERVRKYGLTKFIILYLLGEELRVDSQGARLIDNPQPYLSTNASVNTRQDRLLAKIDEKLDFVFTELDFYIEEQGGETFDYKNIFKSPTAVGALKSEILKSYTKDKKRGKAKEFSLPR